MKHYFIHKQNHPCLTLFFAGWGMDYHPFTDYISEGSDLLICYDYRSLDFDTSLLKDYREIRLVGWSMGVWAAARVLEHTTLPIKESIAVNGTMTPVDDNYGIPRAIFKGTLEGLDERNLHKFYRRMCLPGKELNRFLEKRPRRDVEELKEELRVIGEYVTALPVPDFTWEKAVTGRMDLIFASQNQTNAWKNTQTPCVEYDIPHYCEQVLRNIIEDKTELI